MCLRDGERGETNRRPEGELRMNEIIKKKTCKKKKYECSEFDDGQDVQCVTDVRAPLMFGVSFLLEWFPHCGVGRGGA